MAQTFFIHRYNENGILNWIPVKGYKIIIPSYEKFSMFAHRNAAAPAYQAWHICEETTGCLIHYGRTRQDAIEKTTRFLESKTPDMMRRNINVFISTWNIIPPGRDGALREVIKES